MLWLSDLETQLTVLVRAVFSAVLKDYKHSATLCNQINGDPSQNFVFNYTTHSKCFSSYFVALIISSFSIIFYADFYQSIFFAHFCNLIFKGFLKFFLSIYVQQIILWTICLRNTDHYLKLIPRNNTCCNELCTKYFESNFKILKLQKIPLDILHKCIEFD